MTRQITVKIDLNVATAALRQQVQTVQSLISKLAMSPGGFGGGAFSTLNQAIKNTTAFIGSPAFLNNLKQGSRLQSSLLQQQIAMQKATTGQVGSADHLRNLRLEAQLQSSLLQQQIAMQRATTGQVGSAGHLRNLRLEAQLRGEIARYTREMHKLELGNIGSKQWHTDQLNGIRSETQKLQQSTAAYEAAGIVPGHHKKSVRGSKEAMEEHFASLGNQAARLKDESLQRKEQQNAENTPRGQQLVSNLNYRKVLTDTEMELKDLQDKNALAAERAKFARYPLGKTMEASIQKERVLNETNTELKELQDKNALAAERAKFANYPLGRTMTASIQKERVLNETNTELKELQDKNALAEERAKFARYPLGKTMAASIQQERITGHGHDLKQWGDSIAEELQRSKATSKFLDSPEGLRVLKDIKTIDRMQMEDNRKANRTLNIQQHGRVLGTAKSMIEEGKVNTVDRLLNKGLFAAAGGVGSMIGAASIASPMIGNTWIKSLELLTAVIGRSFIPYMVSWSAGLQGLATNLNSVDIKTRHTLGTIALYGAGVALTGLVLGKGAIGLVNVAHALSTLGMSPGMLGGLGTAGKYAGGIGLGVLVGAAGLMLGSQLSGSKKSWYDPSQINDIWKLMFDKSHIGDMEREQFRGTTTVNRQLPATNQQTLNLVTGDIQRTTNTAQAAARITQELVGRSNHELANQIHIPRILLLLEVKAIPLHKG